MTELTRQMTREEARPSGVTQRAPVRNKKTYTCRGHGAETTKVVRFKNNHSRIFRDSPSAHPPSFSHAIVISFTSVWKGPGTFRLPLTWQMTNKSTVNLWPAGGMYVRQRADASVIRWWMVGTLRIRSFLIKMSSSECLNWVEVRSHPSFGCLSWKDFALDSKTGEGGEKGTPSSSSSALN